MMKLKGSRIENRAKTIEMIKDRYIKELTYGQIAIKYKIDVASARKRILGLGGYPKIDLAIVIQTADELDIKKVNLFSS